MSNYTTKQSSLTASNVVITGILAGQFLAGGLANAAQNNEEQRLTHLPYDTHAVSSSYDQISSILHTDDERSTDKQFIKAVSNFYTNLIENTEPLGAEFEQVLNDNLWDLYEG